MKNIDVTVVLEEKQVNALIAVADKEGVTLSALLRDVVASYIGEYAAVERAYLWAARRHFQETREEDRGDAGQSHEIQNLQDEIASLRDLITEHLAHHGSKEYALQPKEQEDLSSETFFEEVQTASPPLSEINVDATVLVKEREPVAPVIEAPGYGSFQEIIDDKEYSADEVSAYLGLSPTTVRKYAREGKIVAHKVNRTYVFLGEDIREYLLTFSQAKG